jgi:23S rRNA G2069 N7-methylase RlmK/C1962 C5-methylase RlmI
MITNPPTFQKRKRKRKRNHMPIVMILLRLKTFNGAVCTITMSKKLDEQMQNLLNLK